jgi:hypothetical protein
MSDVELNCLAGFGGYKYVVMVGGSMGVEAYNYSILFFINHERGEYL